MYLLLSSLLWTPRKTLLLNEVSIIYQYNLYYSWNYWHVTSMTKLCICSFSLSTNLEAFLLNKISIMLIQPLLLQELWPFYKYEELAIMFLSFGYPTNTACSCVDYLQVWHARTCLQCTWVLFSKFWGLIVKIILGAISNHLSCHILSNFVLHGKSLQFVKVHHAKY